jgi:hypothetical protein
MKIRPLLVFGFGITASCLLLFTVALGKSVGTPDAESIVDVKEAALTHRPLLHRLRLSSLLRPGHDGDTFGKSTDQSLEAVEHLSLEKKIATRKIKLCLKRTMLLDFAYSYHGLWNLNPSLALIDESKTPINGIVYRLPEEAVVHESIKRHLADTTHTHPPAASDITKRKRANQKLVSAVKAHSHSHFLAMKPMHSLSPQIPRMLKYMETLTLSITIFICLTKFFSQVMTCLVQP